MDLTHETTEEQILEPVERAYNALRELGTIDRVSADRWLEAAHALWAAEAVSRVRREIVSCLVANKDRPGGQATLAVRRLLIDILAEGPNDAWSGRKNDARRAAFEAVCREVNDQRWKFPF